VNRAVASLLALALVLISFASFAAPRDKAALKKIDEAINTHYLTTDFDKAESVLLGTVQACADKCSPEVLGKAWMYVGLVRGSGKENQETALEAFRNALAQDPSVTLDEGLATPAAKETFAKAKAAAPSAPVAPPTTPAAPVAPAVAPAQGGLQCSLNTREVETRRPIPVSCTPPEGATGGMVFFQEFGIPEWKSIPLALKGAALEGTIPCTATKTLGTFSFYVEARDSSSNVIASLGQRVAPVTLSLVQTSTQPPPSLPNQPAPERCAEADDCPPDFPGCARSSGGTKEWGDSCGSHDECKSNLCLSGACESCTDDAECPSGSCVEGACTGKGGGKRAGGPYKKLWIGVHGSLDLAFVGGDDVCSPGNEDWTCFDSNDNEFRSAAVVPQYKNSVSGGAIPSTPRVLVSVDYGVTSKLTLGGRLGYAFGGGPKGEASSFLPVHAEARGAYWFTSLSGPGFRPYVHLAGGLGQVDAGVDVTAGDCSTAANPASCAARQDVAGYTETELSAYRRMGQVFAAPGGGVVYAFTGSLGLQANVDLKVLFPSFGLAVTPSLGLVLGL
jgi:hypothetical protein